MSTPIPIATVANITLTLEVGEASSLESAPSWPLSAVHETVQTFYFQVVDQPQQENIVCHPNVFQNT